MYIRFFLFAMVLFLATAPAQAGTRVSIRITGDWQAAQAAAPAQDLRAIETLAGAKSLARCAFTVTVQNGVAVLGGRVFTRQQRDEAERLVAGLDGVTAVRNEVAVLETFLPTTLGARGVVENT